MKLAPAASNLRDINLHFMPLVQEIVAAYEKESPQVVEAKTKELKAQLEKARHAVESLPGCDRDREAQEEYLRCLAVNLRAKIDLIRRLKTLDTLISQTTENANSHTHIKEEQN